MNKQINEKVWARFQRMCEVIDQPYALNYDAAEENYWYLIYEPVGETYTIARKQGNLGKILAGPFDVDEFMRASTLAEVNILARANQEFPSISKKLKVVLAALCQRIEQAYSDVGTAIAPSGYWFLGEENGRYAILESTGPSSVGTPRQVTGWMRRYDFEEALATADAVLTAYSNNVQ